MKTLQLLNEDVCYDCVSTIFWRNKSNLLPPSQNRGRGGGGGAGSTRYSNIHSHTNWDQLLADQTSSHSLSHRGGLLLVPCEV